MKETPQYGPVISDEEYERRIFALYEGQPPMPSKKAEEELRRRELDILIDHRLGCGFPRERRDALWIAQQGIERRRLRLGIETIARAILPKAIRRGAGGLVDFAVREYGKVLSTAELKMFLDLGDDA